MKPFHKTLLIALIHLILGNLIGIYFEGSNIVVNILGVIGLPYSFVAGLSVFAGWDWLSLVFELLGFGFMLILIYPPVVIFSKEK
jgi:hypothetical protein